MKAEDGDSMERGNGVDRAQIAEAIRQAEEAEAARVGPDGAGDGLPPGGTFPGYDVVREIHRGGQGVVYLAIQRTTKRKVAIKVLHDGPFLGSAGRARFEREVQILGQLHHPNIVAIHDSGVTASGSFFYVMEYISGRPLDAVLAESGARPIGETLRLFQTICDAVAAAHLRGVIHRDLKPANIRIDARGEPVLVDFGLAKIAAPDVTEESRVRPMTTTGQFVGSLPWASPEQAEGNGEKIDLRTDVYSLGVILYQMLTGGRFPYQVIGNIRDVLDNILRTEPARPSTIRRKIDDEVETIVLKCLSKDRERRYQSAGELARDVGHYLSGAPIEAKRDSGWYVLTKTLRRYRVRAGVAATMLLMLVVFAAGMTVMYVRATDAERRASLHAAREAVERARAEGNLAAVRRMARTMMDDFYESVSMLRGGTEPQRMVVEQAARYLEDLEAQGSEDPAYLIDLSLAQIRMGELLGGDRLHRLGDTAGAAARYEDAQRTLERAGTIAGVDRGALAGARARREAGAAWIAHQQRRYGDARGLYEGSLMLYDEAIGLAMGEERGRLRDARARVLVSLGDTLQRLAQESMDPAEGAQYLELALARYEESSAHWRGRIEEGRSDREAARELGVAMDHRAAAIIEVAGSLRRRGARLAEEAGAEAASPILDAAMATLMRARVGVVESRGEFERLSLEQPGNAELRRDLAVALHRLGMTYADEATLHSMRRSAPEGAVVGARERALDAYMEALAIHEELATADPSNLEAQRDLAMILNKVGNERRDLGFVPEAERTFERSLALRREIALSDPSPRHTRDLAVGWIKMGEVLRVRADSEPDAGAQRALLERAREHFGEGRVALGTLVESGLMRGDAPEIRQLEAAISGLEGLISGL